MRGEIWAFGTDIRRQHRTLLVIQSDALASAPTVTGLVVTDRPQAAGPPLAVALGNGVGTGDTAWIKITQIHTVPAADARERLGRVDASVLAEVERALAQVLALSA